MDNKIKFEWVEFYEEFANKLLDYKKNRKNLIDIVESVYEEKQINLPTLELDRKIIDIDPFTIFGLFNKGISKENKSKILHSFSEKMNLESNIPTSFDSVPVLNNQNATFYEFSDKREKSDIDDLWELFDSALKYSKDQSDDNLKNFSKYFDIIINKRNNGNSKITMALYWISPNTFLNLDKRNEWFIYESGEIPKKIIDELPKFKNKISSEDYFDITKKMKKFLSSKNSKLKNFKELSLEAWQYSEKINKINKENFKVENLKVKEEEYANYFRWLPDHNVGEAMHQYINGLSKIEKDYNVNIQDEYKKNECADLLNSVANDSNGKKTGNGKNFTAYLRKYIEYLKKQANSSVKENFELGEKISGFIKSNTIFYGVPGCGKSHFVKNLLKDKNDNDINEKYYKRILFHPEYTYSDFVGQILPKNNENKIEYAFQEGPFLEILKKALEDKENHYFLIIEEINRGNAPAIFGDIFQLLDRNENDDDKNGESEYKIDNKNAVEWLQKNLSIAIEKLYIPSNLTIFATMNTSDQNVFTIDTAFKRRWRMHRIKNNFDDDKNLILSKSFSFDKREIKWKKFAQALNKDIIENCNDGMIVEDKLIGTNFVKLKDLEDTKKLSEKVFMYLWTDVVKYNKEQLFKPEYKLLDDAIEDFTKGKNVFSERCTNLMGIFENHEE